jgi:hypothetical protein
MALNSVKRGGITMRLFIITVVLIVFGAGEAFSMTPVTVNFKGKPYTFQYEFYDEPMVLDFKTPSNDRSTPLGTMKAFLYIKSHLEDYKELAEFECKTNGTPVLPIPEEYITKLLQDREYFLAAELTVYGEILFEDYHIYITKFSPGPNRFLGAVLKKINDRYFVIEDLTVTNEFVGELSSKGYAIEKIRSLYEVQQ